MTGETLRSFVNFESNSSSLALPLRCAMRKVVLFLCEMPWPMFFGFVFGAVAGCCFGTITAHGINAEIEREQRIEQQCIDGNNNACRVMGYRRG
ncbi:hypothetical protein ABQW72_05435 [Xanthomonas hortorum pv. pelargonii]|uniref:hypothetical protein n=1 Tax=Xanthomonas hortorum TaxID=56454 RepID=UPI0032E8F21A